MWCFLLILILPFLCITRSGKDVNKTLKRVKSYDAIRCDLQQDLLNHILLLSHESTILIHLRSLATPHIATHGTNHHRIYPSNNHFHCNMHHLLLSLSYKSCSHCYHHHHATPLYIMATIAALSRADCSTHRYIFAHISSLACSHSSLLSIIAYYCESEAFWDEYNPLQGHLSVSCKYSLFLRFWSSMTCTNNILSHLSTPPVSPVKHIFHTTKSPSLKIPLCAHIDPRYWGIEGGLPMY